MVGRKEEGKPRGRMSSYAFFVQTCREEHKKKHPNDTVVFTEFTKKCAEKWKEMTPKEKKRFEDMADKDKSRYEREMSVYVPTGVPTKKKKRPKDPNAPKRALSAFFFFCAEERPSVRQINPGMSVADIAKELGKRWEICANRAKFEVLAQEDKQRYDRDMTSYRNGTYVPGMNTSSSSGSSAGGVGLVPGGGMAGVVASVMSNMMGGGVMGGEAEEGSSPKKAKLDHEAEEEEEEED